ncbi:MAG: hypothetical protein ABIJ18_01585 [archaeon]
MYKPIDYTPKEVVDIALDIQGQIILGVALARIKAGDDSLNSSILEGFEYWRNKDISSTIYIFGGSIVDEVGFSRMGEGVTETFRINTKTLYTENEGRFTPDGYERSIKADRINLAVLVDEIEGERLVRLREKCEICTEREGTYLFTTSFFGDHDDAVCISGNMTFPETRKKLDRFIGRANEFLEILKSENKKR